MGLLSPANSSGALMSGWIRSAVCGSLALAMASPSLAQSRVEIRRLQLVAMRVIDMPLKDYPGTINAARLDTVRQKLLRFDFSANANLRKLSLNWSMAAHAKPCEWAGESWEEPSYSSDLISDEFGLIQRPEVTWYGLDIRNSNSQLKYHFYLSLVPPVAPEGSSISDYDLERYPRNVCLGVHFMGGEDKDFRSNIVIIPATDIRSALSGR